MYATYEIRRYESDDARGETVWSGDDADIGREYLDDHTGSAPASSRQMLFPSEMESARTQDGATLVLMVSTGTLGINNSIDIGTGTGDPGGWPEDEMEGAT